MSVHAPSSEYHPLKARPKLESGRQRKAPAKRVKDPSQKETDQRIADLHEQIDGASATSIFEKRVKQRRNVLERRLKKEGISVLPQIDDIEKARASIQRLPATSDRREERRNELLEQTEDLQRIQELNKRLQRLQPTNELTQSDLEETRRDLVSLPEKTPTQKKSKEQLTRDLDSLVGREAKDGLRKRYNHALKVGLDTHTDRLKKWGVKNNFFYLLQKIERQIDELPENTRRERAQKAALIKKLKPWSNTQKEFDLASGTLTPFYARVNACYEAQHELYKFRNLERITALDTAVQALRTEYRRLLTDTEETIAEKKITPEELQAGIQRIPLSQTIEEAAKYEDVNVVHHLKESGELKKLEQLVQMFEELSDFEQENLRIQKSPEQEPGVKPSHSLDDINELRRIRGLLSEKPSAKILPTDRINEAEPPVALKSQRELMMDSHAAQKAELDKKKKVLLERFGQERLPKEGELHASFGSWLKDAAFRVIGKRAQRFFGVLNYIPNHQLLKEYREQETEVKRLEEYYQTPEAVVDRHSKVRAFQQNLVQAIGVFGDRSETIQHKQEAVERVKEAVAAQATKNFLPTDSFDLLINSFQKTLPKAVQAMERYQQEERKLAQEQSERVKEMQAEIGKQNPHAEETGVIPAAFAEISDGLQRILIREWEAYAPLPLVKQRRRLIEAVSEHGQDQKLQDLLKEVRSQTKGMNIEDYPKALSKSEAWRDAGSIDRGLVEEIIHMEKRIEALREAHDLENELKHNLLLQKTKRAQAAHQKKIDRLYSLAYDTSTLSVSQRQAA